MPGFTTEPVIRQAAVLTAHWAARDIEAVVFLLAGIRDKEEAEDLVIALLQLRDKSDSQIARIVRAVPA